MAFLDDTGVENLASDIKTFADATYAPLSGMTGTSFLGTVQPGNATGNCNGLYIAALNLVILTFNFVASSSVGTSDSLFIIPTEYAPSSAKHGSGYGKSSSATGALRVNVTSDGFVRQGTMSACTGGCGVIAYTLD